MSKKKKNTPKRRRRPTENGLPEGPLRFFFLAKQGFVQRMVSDILGDGVERKWWPIAHTHEDANRLVDYLGLRDQGVRPAEIGTIDHETFAGHLHLAFLDNCEFIVTVAGWMKNGTMLTKRTRLANIYPGPEAGR